MRETTYWTGALARIAAMVLMLAAAGCDPVKVDAPPTPDTGGEPDTPVSDAVADAEPEPEPDAAPDAAPEPDAAAEPEPDAPGPDAVAEPEPDAVAEPEPDAVAEPEPDTVAEAEPDAVAETEPDAVAEPEPDAVVDAETGPADVPVSPDAQPDAGCTGPTCLGAPAPEYALEDFQPATEMFGESYGIDAFTGKTVVLALWAGW